MRTLLCAVLRNDRDADASFDDRRRPTDGGSGRRGRDERLVRRERPALSDVLTFECCVKRNPFGLSNSSLRSLSHLTIQQTVRFSQHQRKSVAFLYRPFRFRSASVSSRFSYFVDTHLYSKRAGNDTAQALRSDRSVASETGREDTASEEWVIQSKRLYKSVALGVGIPVLLPLSTPPSRMLTREMCECDRRERCRSRDHAFFAALAALPRRSLR